VCQDNKYPSIKIVVVSKKPVDANAVKNIINRFGAEGASLTDFRIAAVASLNFAGGFGFFELANIKPKHIFTQ